MCVGSDLLCQCRKIARVAISDERVGAAENQGFLPA